MREFLELLSGLVEQVDGLADCAGEQALAFLAGMGGDVLHPFQAEVGDDGADAAEFAIVAAGDEAGGGGIGRERQDGAVMCLDRPPGVAIGESTRRSVPSPRAKASVVPARSKLAATTKASSSRWTPRVSSRNWATDSLIVQPPSPNPLPQGEGEHLGAAQLTASINHTPLEPAPQPRPVQVAPDEHDPAHPRLALLPRPDEIAIGNHVHRLEREPPIIVRV